MIGTRPGTTAPHVPILAYHEISPTPHPKYRAFTVTPSQFDRQMNWLARKGYRTITFDDLVAHRSGGRPLPSRPVIITFDDGCRSAAEYAAATLPNYGFSATFYLVPAVIGSATTWARDRRYLPVLDWNMAERLQALGFTCGSHTFNHRRLATVDAAECRDELERSRAILEERLGREVVHLSYPHGSFNAEVRRMAAEAGYRTACTVEHTLSSPAHDLLALPRVRPSGDEPFRDFTLRVRMGKPLDGLLPRSLLLLAARAQKLMGGRR
jgi:peptidoglycan/xylan/chitin deacetylase (PgdA/CDA1 family)